MNEHKSKHWKNIWKEKPNEFMKMEHASQKNSLHAEISKFINQSNYRHIFDYGCGDGRLIEMLNANVVVDLFDINEEMLALSYNRLGERINNYFREIRDVKNHSYDCIVLNMVLICISDKQTFVEVLSNIYRIKKRDGFLLIGLTHPCFREEKFSDFQTSYVKKRNLDYFKESDSFDVIINENDAEVVFQDYHWSLEFTLNTLLETGFQLKQIQELKDYPCSQNFNKLKPPFILLKLT
jgi:SAM-dependent methyltransferase